MSLIVGPSNVKHSVVGDPQKGPYLTKYIQDIIGLKMSVRLSSVEICLMPVSKVVACWTI